MTTATITAPNEVKTRTILVAKSIQVPVGPVSEMEYRIVGVIQRGENSTPVYTRYAEMDESYLLNALSYDRKAGKTSQAAVEAELSRRGLEF